MSNDTTRDAFEAQICSQFPTIIGGVLTRRNKSGDYSSLVVHHAYLAWQAATEQGKRQPLKKATIEILWTKLMCGQGSGDITDFVRDVEAAHGITPPQGEI